MPRFVALFASLALATASTLLTTGCASLHSGSIHTAALPSASVRLTPNPPHIYIAPFDTSTGKWLVGRDGDVLTEFKEGFQTNFSHQLRDRLMKLAPTDFRWVDDLPDKGWLVTGQFDTVFQGSRALRTVVGAGYGETTFQTTVYVYDLSISKTRYVLAFRTGVPDANHNGSGSGSFPAGLSAAGEPITTLTALGSGLKLDTTRTAREIANYLAPYVQ